MKNLFSILAISLLFACSNPEKSSDNSKTDTVAKTSSVDTTAVEEKLPTTVEEIKNLYNSTNYKIAKGDLDSVSYKYNCANERSGTITYFSDNGKLRIIKHSYAEYDHHEATDQFFMLDDTVYFVFYNRVSWSFVSGGAAEGVTKDDITEQRFYLVNNQPIQCLEKKFSKHSNESKVVNATNKVVKCSTAEPLLVAYKKLLAFKNQPQKDCLNK